MLGDNELSTAAMIPPRLNKCHTALSYHRVREAISAGIMRFFHIGVDNSDIPPSTGSRASMAVLKPMLFYAWQVPQRIPPSFPNGEPAASEPRSEARSLQMKIGVEIHTTAPSLQSPSKPSPPSNDCQFNPLLLVLSSFCYRSISPCTLPVIYIYIFHICSS
jgi:hypothetical protein